MTNINQLSGKKKKRGSVRERKPPKKLIEKNNFDCE
jgi:hypothetical protein